MRKSFIRSFSCITKAYRKVDLIIPFREIMVVEKRPDNPTNENFDLQSALVITTKDHVKTSGIEISGMNLDFLGWSIHSFSIF